MKGVVASLMVQLGADNADLRNGLKRARTDLEKFAGHVNSVGNNLVGIGGIATAALGGAVHSMREWAEAVNDMEDKTGMAGEAASELLYITKTVGLNTSDAADSMMKLSRAAATAYEQQQQAAASGREASDAFTKYGISIKDANGNLLSAQQILANVAEAHRNMANGVQKNALEMELFGRSGGKLNDLLNLSAKQLRDLSAEAKKSGLVISSETSQAWEDFSQKINRSKNQMMGAAVQIGGVLLPVLDDLMSKVLEACKWYSNLTQRNKDLIATALEVGVVLGGVGVACKFVAGTVVPLIAAIRGAIAAFKALRTAAIMARAASVAALSVGMAALAVAGVAAAGAGIADAASDYSSSVSKRKSTRGGGAGAYLKRTASGMHSNSSAYKKAQADNHAAALAKAREEAEKANAEATRQEQQIVATANNFDVGGGGGSGGGGGGGGSYDNAAEEAKRKAEELARKVKEIKEETERAAQSARTLAKEFNTAGIRLRESMLEGAAAVKANIDAQERDRLAVLDDYAEKYKKAVEEAEEHRRKAAETGEAEVIALTQKALEERKAAEIAAAQEIAARRVAIHEEAEKQRNAISTQARMIEADMEVAHREGNVTAYVEALNEQNAAFLSDLAGRRAEMEAYKAWEMEATQTNAQLQIDAINKFKEGTAAAFADAIVYNKNLMQALQGLAAQIVQMYIKERIEQAISQKLASAARARATAEQAAQLAALNGPAQRLAVNMSIATSGQAALTGAASYMSAQAAAASFSLLGVPKLARGGVAYGPTFSLIGEGNAREAVLPLTDSTYRDLARGINEQGGGGGVTLNVTTMDASSFEGWLRTRGGRVLENYFKNQRAEFKFEGVGL